MKTNNNFKNLKEKYLVHKKQQKFQVSFFDWTPYFDWYLVMCAFLASIILVSGLAYYTYKNVVATMSDFENIEVKDRTLNIEGYLQVKKDYDNKAEVLNSLQ
jgi:hypothetical protein